MIGVVAILKVREGAGPAFEEVFRELASKVRAQEPGNLVYQLTKSRAEPDTYKVLELYKDQAALSHHATTDYFRDLGRRMGPFMAGRPDVEYLDAVE
ncbi:MAG: antibiotic biosynthesis monooxygenase [Caulobacteraceae bacterium]|nr:antibiotic biosynthesis monooxygenase [Caulobacteraceae bacterium]